MWFLFLIVLIICAAFKENIDVQHDHSKCVALQVNACKCVCCTTMASCACTGQWETVYVYGHKHDGGEKSLIVPSYQRITPN
jgi:hypothetical protein